MWNFIYKFIYFNYILKKKEWLCYCLQRSHIHFYHSTIFHTFNHTRIFSHCDSGWSDSHPEHLCWNEVEAIFLDGLFFLFEKYLESQISACDDPQLVGLTITTKKKDCNRFFGPVGLGEREPPTSSPLFQLSSLEFISDFRIIK